MRQLNQSGEKQGSKLDKVEIQSSSLRRGSLPGHGRNKSRSVPRQQGASSHVSRPLYEQTYYISKLRDNYLTLISDNMQILQLPLGLIQQNIRIGCPIKLRLQYDHKRQQVDEHRFKTIEQQLYEQFRSHRGSHNQ